MPDAIAASAPENEAPAPDDRSDAPTPPYEQLERELAEARRTIEHLERRQRIDALLAEADAIDLDAARLLTERAVETMDEPDLALAVKDLKRHKPYLFRRPAPPWSGSTMSPRSDGEGDDLATAAASRAAQSGARRDLLDYLRLRRRS